MGGLPAVVVLREEGDESIDVVSVGRLGKGGDDPYPGVAALTCHGASLAAPPRGRNPRASPCRFAPCGAARRPSASPAPAGVLRAAASRWSARSVPWAQARRRGGVRWAARPP